MGRRRERRKERWERSCEKRNGEERWMKGGANGDKRKEWRRREKGKKRRERDTKRRGMKGMKEAGGRMRTKKG